MEPGWGRLWIASQGDPTAFYTQAGNQQQRMASPVLYEDYFGALCKVTRRLVRGLLK